MSTPRTTNETRKVDHMVKEGIIDAVEAEAHAWEFAAGLEEELTTLTTQVNALLADKSISFRDMVALSVYQAKVNQDGTITQAARELGIETSEYNPDKHWDKLVALRCYRAADVFIEVRANTKTKEGKV